MDEKAFDAQSAQEWIASVEKAGPTLRDQDIYPMLDNWLARVQPRRVLDIGCGQGICADKLNLQFIEYSGIDPSPFLIARAQELYAREGRTFAVGNAYAVTADDGSYDAAFSVLVWHLLSDIERAAAEMSRVLGDGGAFMIITANPASLAQWAAMYDTPVVSGHKLEGVMHASGTAGSRDVLYFHDADAITHVLAQAGLHVTQSATFRPAKAQPDIDMLLCLSGLRKVA